MKRQSKQFKLRVLLHHFPQVCWSARDTTSSISHSKSFMTVRLSHTLVGSQSTLHKSYTPWSGLKCIALPGFPDIVFHHWVTLLTRDLTQEFQPNLRTLWTPPVLSSKCDSSEPSSSPSSLHQFPPTWWALPRRSPLFNWERNLDTHPAHAKTNNDTTRWTTGPYLVTHPART